MLSRRFRKLKTTRARVRPVAETKYRLKCVGGCWSCVTHGRILFGFGPCMATREISSFGWQERNRAHPTRPDTPLKTGSQQDDSATLTSLCTQGTNPPLKAPFTAFLASVSPPKTPPSTFAHPFRVNILRMVLVRIWSLPSAHS